MENIFIINSQVGEKTPYESSTTIKRCGSRRVLITAAKDGSSDQLLGYMSRLLIGVVRFEQ